MLNNRVLDNNNENISFDASSKGTFIAVFLENDNLKLVDLAVERATENQNKM